MSENSNPSRRRRVAKPATSPRALAAARRRRDELLAVLQLRGKPVDRSKLNEKQLKALESSPYGKAAPQYLLSHRDFAYRSAMKIEARHVPLEDVVQAAFVGMLTALDRFDAKRVTSGAVTSFLSYARWWVFCEIQRLLEDEGLVKIPAGARKEATTLRRRIGEVADALGVAVEQLTDEEVARRLGESIERVKTYRHLYLGNEHRRVDEGRRKNDVHSGDLLVAEHLQERQAVAEDDVATKLRGEALDVAVSKLPPLQRRLVGEQFGLAVDAAAAKATLPSCARQVAALLRAALGRIRWAVEAWETEGEGRLCPA